MHITARLSILFALTLASVACGNGKPEPLSSPITFTLDNALASSVFAEYKGCGVDAWVTIRDANGSDLVLDRGGACTSECGEPPVLCATLVACIEPVARELAPGAKLTLDWNGIFDRWNQAESCNEPIAASGILQAEFCWGDASGTDGQVQNRACKSVSFNVRAGEDVLVSTGS